ncbi:MAG: acetyl-CoA carboxylase biotin carboxyl carrier protein subunit [Blastocatellia bacterium]
MKLELNIDGNDRAADFQLRDGQAVIDLDGQPHTAEVSEPEPGLYVIVLGNRIYRCTLERHADGTTEAIVNGRRIPVALRDPRRMRGGAAGAAGAGGRATLTAPMPGKIVRLLCATGDEVVSGQSLLVVEAMKMQNEVLAPRAGKVAEIRVAEGQTVNAGEIMVIVE